MPTECGEHEHWDEFGNVCDATCDSPAVCPVNPRPECVCDKGYVRQNGICILKEDCPVKPVCGTNQEYLNCGYCEFVCGTGGPKCPPGCRAEGCYCIDGYVRDENNDCIPRGDCPESEFD